jgi:hypothetical protein
MNEKNKSWIFHTLALCYVQGIRTNQGIDSIPCVFQTTRRKKHAFHTTIMMRLGIAKHACREEVRFHTTSTVRSSKLSGGGGFLRKVQQCLDCQATSPSMRFVLVSASDDQQDGPNRRCSGEFLAPIKPRQRQVLTNVTTRRSTSGRERDVQELVQEDNFCSESLLRAQETAAIGRWRRGDLPGSRNKKLKKRRCASSAAGTA